LRARRSVVGLCGAVLLFGIACSGSHKQLDAPRAAIYRAKFDPGGGEKTRRFRFLVYAAAPDRLHGEVLSSLGTTELVLDAGAQRISVFLVREGVAYVGDADERALDALFGVPLDPRDLVEVLLGGSPRASALEWAIVPGGTGYPQSIELRHEGRRLALELKRVRPMRADPATLGTGRPPPGAEERPLDVLDRDSLPGIEVDGEGEA